MLVVCLYFLTLVLGVIKGWGPGSYWIIFTYNSLHTCMSMQIILVTMKLIPDKFARVDLFIEVSCCIFRGCYQKSLYHFFVDVFAFGVSHPGLL